MTPVDAPILAGRHVRLEPLEHRHAPGLAAAAAEDRSTYGYSRVPEGEAGAHAFVRAAQEAWAAGTDCAFATVWLEGDGGPRVVGSTRFMDLQRWHGRTTGPPDVAEVGNTWLAASAQRTVVNTEAKLLMLTHAFEVWGVHRLFLKTDVRNGQSRVAIERLGARFEGVLRANMPSWADGSVRDTAYYSILPDEWPEVKAGLVARLTIPALGPAGR
jgi:N-acetyltransferase